MLVRLIYASRSTTPINSELVRQILDAPINTTPNAASPACCAMATVCSYRHWKGARRSECAVSDHLPR
jgi:hypothetical protein